jgi:hypothetical protein
VLPQASDRGARRPRQACLTRHRRQNATGAAEGALQTGSMEHPRSVSEILSMLRWDYMMLGWDAVDRRVPEVLGWAMMRHAARPEAIGNR